MAELEVTAPARAVNLYEDRDFVRHERAYRAGWTEVPYEDRPDWAHKQPDNGDQWTVEVEAQNGVIYRYYRDLTEPQAERLVEMVNAQGNFEPVGYDKRGEPYGMKPSKRTIDTAYWHFHRYVYGSIAYHRDNVEEQRALEERRDYY